jgi:hypothetical protein
MLKQLFFYILFLTALTVFSEAKTMGLSQPLQSVENIHFQADCCAKQACLDCAHCLVIGINSCFLEVSALISNQIEFMLYTSYVSFISKVSTPPPIV